MMFNIYPESDNEDFSLMEESQLQQLEKMADAMLYPESTRSSKLSCS